jgi:hypothetical protein
MAITMQDYNELEKESKGLLEVNTSDFYFKTVRPLMDTILLKYKTDKELIRTIEKVINAADSFCIRKDYKSFIESFETLQTVITGNNYFYGVMSKASEEEKEAIRTLISKLDDLNMIVQCEDPYTPKEKKTKDRLNYKEPDKYSPIGENMDYVNHNMKILNESNPKKRIPNK